MAYQSLVEGQEVVVGRMGQREDAEELEDLDKELESLNEEGFEAVCVLVLCVHVFLSRCSQPLHCAAYDPPEVNTRGLMHTHIHTHGATSGTPCNRETSSEGTETLRAIRMPDRMVAAPR